MTFLCFLLIHVNLSSNVNHFFSHDGQKVNDDDHDNLKVSIDVNQKDGDDGSAF